MQQRENIGYIITDSVTLGETEFVLGVHKDNPNRFVTWACTNGTNYFWGHYLTSREAAEKDLVSRLNDQMQLLDHIRGKNRRSERSMDAR